MNTARKSATANRSPSAPIWARLTFRVMRPALTAGAPVAGINFRLDKVAPPGDTSCLKVGMQTFGNRARRYQWQRPGDPLQRWVSRV